MGIYETFLLGSFLCIGSQISHRASQSSEAEDGGNSVPSSGSRFLVSPKTVPSQPHLVPGWGTVAVFHQPEEGGPPLAFCITAAHALAWAFQAGLGLHQGSVLASDQLGHLLFVLGRARSWHRGLQGCQHFIFRDRKMLAFWQLLLF